MRWIAWLVLLAAAVLPAAAGQGPEPTDSLRVGRVELSLGMPEKTAITILRSQFHVERARGAGDAWAVIKDGDTVAIASFSEDKLSRVSKTWVSTGGRDAAGFADRIYSLAGEFAAQGRAQCTLAAKPYKVAGVEGRIVTLACGNKSMQIVQSRSGRGAWVTSLLEVLQ
jgi:hypothetical protein